MVIDVKELLKRNLKDDVIVFQTDTVYGIGCLLESEVGVKRIYEIKKRDGKKPLALLCGNIAQVKSVVTSFELGEKLAKKHWPGALTLILPKNEKVGDFLTSGFQTVGVRIPKDKVALELLNHFGPMAVTSLNLSTEPAILKYEDALLYKDEVSYLVKGKDLNHLSSTVYDCINRKTLRQGEVIID